VANLEVTSGSFFFSYLPAGSYTLALSCRAASDDPVLYQPETIIIPAPSGHADSVSELTLNAGEDAVLAFGFVPTEEVMLEPVTAP
jgi:hypothetical protein